MPKQVKLEELQLPVPARLVGQGDMGIDKELRTDMLATFLAGRLADGVGIESWLAEHARVVAELPDSSELVELSPRNRVYDRYFDVCRHGGAATMIPFALGQVMGEISRELGVGSSLDEQDLTRLLDGLAAVLEATSEC